jgi:hypothetical protein
LDVTRDIRCFRIHIETVSLNAAAAAGFPRAAFFTFTDAKLQRHGHGFGFERFLPRETRVNEGGVKHGHAPCGFPSASIFF